MKPNLINYIVLAEQYLQPRKADASKSDYGHALLVGGDYGMAGAIKLAAETCARTGAGLITAVTRKKHVQIINATRPEIMVHGTNSSDDCEKYFEKATVVAIGPGLGQETWGRSFFKAVVDINKPLVVDADALNLLAKHPRQSMQWILTPHPGEAARLLETTTRWIQLHRVEAVMKLQQLYHGVVILKGCETLVCDHEQKVFYCDKGNPGMATGGMGDALTGIILGLLAQKLPLDAAAKLGVYIHSYAADLAAEHTGQRGLLASDLLLYIRKSLNP